MAKKPDPFEDPDRDNQIARGEIKLDPRFFNRLNQSELVQLVQLLNPHARAHRGMSREELFRLLEGYDRTERRNPVDRYRKLIRAFLRVYWKRVKDQFEPTCSGNCFECHDIVVLSCYIVNHKRLSRFRAERAKED